MGQEDLGGVPAVAAEELVVGTDQVGLADGGGGLERGEVAGPPLEVQEPDPGADGPRTHERHPTAPGGEGGELLGQVPEPVEVERAVRGGQNSGPDLDDPSVGGVGELPTDEVDPGCLRVGRGHLGNFPRVAPAPGPVEARRGVRA